MFIIRASTGLLPVLARIINKCLSTGLVPSAFREVLVIPLLKKSNAQTVLKNFRPISNLPFLSKILEKVAIDQMSSYCETRNLNEPLQSAYRRGHSTKTALLKICNDILSNMDKDEVTTMAMLDLSAAFDTVASHYFPQSFDGRFKHLCYPAGMDGFLP